VPFIYKNASFCQDRLGTDIGKALKKETVFLQLRQQNALRPRDGQAQHLLSIHSHAPQWCNGAVRKTASFFEFSPCLSRACLGKLIVFIYQWLKNAVLRRSSVGTRADVELMENLYIEDWWIKALAELDQWHGVKKVFHTCQDRLGTNMEKVEKSRVFRRHLASQLFHAQLRGSWPHGSRGPVRHDRQPHLSRRSTRWLGDAARVLAPCGWFTSY
jgi:hypothetical protein